MCTYRHGLSLCRHDIDTVVRIRSLLVFLTLMCRMANSQPAGGTLPALAFLLLGWLSTSALHCGTRDTTRCAGIGT